MSEPRNDFNGEAVPWYMRPEQDPVAPPPTRQGTAGPAPADDIPADKPTIVSPPDFDGDDAAGTEILAEESIFVAKPVFASSPPAHGAAPAGKDSARLSVAEFLASGPQTGLPRWAGVGPAAPRSTTAAAKARRGRPTAAASKPSSGGETAQTESATSSGGLPAASWPLAVKRQAEAEVPTSPVGLSLAALRQALTEPPQPTAPPPDPVETAQPQANAQSATPAEELRTEMLAAPSSFVPARVQQPAPTAAPELGETADDEPPTTTRASSEIAPLGKDASAAQQEPAAEMAATAAPEQASAPVAETTGVDGPGEQDAEAGPASSDDALAPAPLADDESPSTATAAAPPASAPAGETAAASATPETKQEDTGQEPVAPVPVGAGSPTPQEAEPNVEPTPAPGEAETASPGDGPSAPTYPVPGEAESATPDGDAQLAEASAAPAGEPHPAKVSDEAVAPAPLAPEPSAAAVPEFAAADGTGSGAAPDTPAGATALLPADLGTPAEASATDSSPAVERPAVVPPSEEDVPSDAAATQAAAATAPPSPAAPSTPVTPPELAAKAAEPTPPFPSQTPEPAPTPSEAEPETFQVHTETEPEVTPVADASAAPARETTEAAAPFGREPAKDLPAQDSPPDWSLAATEAALGRSAVPAESTPAESAPQSARRAAAAVSDAAETPTSVEVDAAVTPAEVDAAVTPAEVDAAPAPHPAAKGPAVPAPATPATEPLATPRRSVPAAEEQPTAAQAVGDGYPLNAAAPTAADAAPSDAWMRALDAEYRRPVDPAEAAAQSTTDTPAAEPAGSEQTPPAEQPPAAAVPPTDEPAPEASAPSATPPDPGEVDSTAIRRYSLLSAARTREPSKPATDSTPNLVYDDAYELVGPESPPAPAAATPGPDKESDRPAASATAPAPVRRRSRRELLAAENGAPHRGTSERHSGEGPAALTGKRPRLTSPHPPVLSETPSSSPTVHEIAANVAASLSGSPAPAEREPTRFVDTEEERTAPLASLSATEDTLVADKGLLADADYQAAAEPATGWQPGEKAAEAADAVAPPTAPRGFGLTSTATGPASVPETAAETAQLPTADPEEAPAWQPLGPDDIKPRRPRPAPTATRPEAVLDGASVQPAPLSRSSAHWWSLLVALVLAPLGWGLTWDAANRLMGTTVTQVYEQEFTVTRPGLLPLLELVVGLLLLAVVFLAGRWSAAGLLVVGAVWSAVGLLALLLPEIFLSPLEPLINDMLTQASFWPSVAFLLLVATISGQLLFFGAIMLFGGLISHGARRQGQREQASLDALQRRQSS
ncbi:hypothetical protein [Buchananella hordeovulneris]|uniref:Uncharacterized protein n=1 Tax=Buchananella hordeovulneris TaxID=52770 RepID=A0A1Q5PUZ9_9ACTO|nr:hypothetical protein [Buchananella hordeovulneris]OKL51322.1 hypothetical protein BSZ40_08420 [Buchananella hordeovulneris]